MCIQKKVGSGFDLKTDGEAPYLSKIKSLFETEDQKVVKADLKNGVATITVDRVTARNGFGTEHSVFSFKCNVNNDIFNNKEFSIDRTFNKSITKEVIKTVYSNGLLFDHVIVNDRSGFGRSSEDFIPHLCNPKDGKWISDPIGIKQFVCSKCGNAFSNEETNPFKEHPMVEKAKKELDQLKSEKRSIKQKIRDKKNDIIKKRQITDTIARKMVSDKGL